MLPGYIGVSITNSGKQLLNMSRPQDDVLDQSQGLGGKYPKTIYRTRPLAHFHEVQEHEACTFDGCDR